MDAEADRHGGQAGVLGEVVADHGVPLGVAVAYVEDSGTGRVGGERRRGRRVRGRGRVRLRVSHWEGAYFLVGQALVGIAVPPGAVLYSGLYSGLFAATVPHLPEHLMPSSPERVAARLAPGDGSGRTGRVGAVRYFTKGFQGRRASPGRGIPRPGRHRAATR
ncbi:hypothetical protein GCM10010358_45050 [Streptomyces minutiscleroticus]|uniref:Uncharacterized protein n=1 Tax=Streptomyces minutiscleroticus TaxID=68238 RepID=A0A918NPL3_9ACTN|nr:hypothetical protein GCM10010358_45050 [Streptomyces minutiscleroticus]